MKVGRGFGVSSTSLLRILNLVDRDHPRTLRSVLEMPRCASEPVVPIELCGLRRALAAQCSSKGRELGTRTTKRERGHDYGRHSERPRVGGRLTTSRSEQPLCKPVARSRDSKIGKRSSGNPKSVCDNPTRLRLRSSDADARVRLRPARRQATTTTTSEESGLRRQAKACPARHPTT